MNHYDLDYESAVAFRREIIRRLEDRLEKIRALNDESKRHRRQNGDPAS